MESHPLTRERVQKVVPDAQAGFYRLGYALDGQFHTTYVGRSDSSLKRRLLEHARNRWQEAFIVRPTENIVEAYRMECLYYHLESDSIGNKIHPASPDCGAIECPYCIQESTIASNPATSTIKNVD